MKADIAHINAQTHTQRNQANKLAAETMYVDTQRRLGEANVLGVSTATDVRRSEASIKRMLLRTYQENPGLMLLQQTPISQLSSAAQTAIGAMAALAGAIGIGKAFKYVKANNMIKKSINFRQFRAMIKQIDKF